METDGWGFLCLIFGVLFVLTGIVSFLRRAPKDMGHGSDRRLDGYNKGDTGWLTGMTNVFLDLERLHKGSTWSAIVQIIIGLVLLCLALAMR